MSSYQQLSAEINFFLASQEEAAICIFGEWGIGKTYAWTKLLDLAINEARLSKRRYSYASLFGLSSLEQLKSTIFENTNFIIDPNETDEEMRDIKIAGNKFLEAAKKNKSLLAAIPLVGKVLSEAGPMYFASVRNQIICIDDLERRGDSLNLRDVLGLVSFLKEERKCKVILLLNDNELGSAKTQFFDNFEKVFDLSLRFVPTSVESTNIVITGDDRVSRMIRENCIKLDISNIRVIMKIDRFARKLEALLQEFSEPVIEQAMSALTLFCFSKFLPRAAPSTDYILNGHLRALMRTGSSEISAEESKWRPLLSSYGFLSVSEFDKKIIEGIDNGFFDSQGLIAAGKQAEISFEAQGRHSPLSKGWDLFRNSFEDNKPEVVRALKMGVINTKEIEVLNLDSTIRLLKQLGHADDANEALQDFVKKCSLTKSEKFWDLRNHHMGRPSDCDVVKAFEAKFADVKSSPDPKGILLKAAERGGWSEDDVAYLAQWPIESYKKLLLQSQGEELQSIIKGGFLFGRISNGSKEMAIISERLKTALEIIAETSDLNNLRVSNLTGIASR